MIVSNKCDDMTHGVIAVLGQSGLTTVVGFIMDRLKNKMKMTLLVLISLATAGFVWLMLMCLQIIPFSIGLSTAILI